MNHGDCGYQILKHKLTTLIILNLKIPKNAFKFIKIKIKIENLITLIYTYDTEILNLFFPFLRNLSVFFLLIKKKTISKIKK